jgi:hypothetical protein
MALDAVADTVAADLLKGATFPAGRPVALVAPAPGDTLGLVTQRLMERMKALGVSVRLARSEAQAPGTQSGVPATGNPVVATGTPSVVAPGDSAAPVVSHATDPAGPLRLQILVEGSGVTHVRRLGSFPFGTKGYERLAGMRASATFDPMNGDGLDALRGTGAVMWSRGTSPTPRVGRVSEPADPAGRRGGSSR